MDQNATQTPTAQSQMSPPSPLPITNTQPPKVNYVKRLFQGRLNIRNFWIGTALQIGVLIVIFFLPALSSLFSPITEPFSSSQDALQEVVSNPTPTNPISAAINIIFIFAFLIYFILLIPVTLSLQIRRLHDLELSGWLYLVTLIPFIGALFSFCLMFFPGTKGDNKYGPKPLPRINIKQDILKLG